MESRAYQATPTPVLVLLPSLLTTKTNRPLLQGQTSTVPVTLDDMVYPTQCVARGNRTAWVIGDLPFGSYQESKEQALRSATALMQAGAQMSSDR